MAYDLGGCPLRHFLQQSKIKNKTSFPKISPHDFYFFAFVFNLYLLYIVNGWDVTPVMFVNMS